VEEKQSFLELLKLYLKRERVLLSLTLLLSGTITTRRGTISLRTYSSEEICGTRRGPDFLGSSPLLPLYLFSLPCIEISLSLFVRS